MLAHGEVKASKNEGNRISKHMQEESKKIHLAVVHVKAARGLLEWTVADLAEKSGVSPDTIHKWENRKAKPRQSTRDAIQKAFEDVGIEFSNGGEPGVKRRRLPV